MRRNTTLINLIAGSLLVASLSGCNTLGKRSDYTKESQRMAVARLNAVKAGVEWQAAERQMMVGDLDKAQRTIERVILNNPELPKAHVLRGRILMERGNLEMARAALEEAAKLDATNVEVPYYLGIIAERTQQYQQASELYTRAMELDPDNVQYVIATAEMHIQQGNITQGEGLLKSKLDAFANSAAVRHTLGQLEMIRGNFDQSAAYFDDARMLAPDDPIILEDLTRAQISARQFAKADLNLQTLIKHPENEGRADLQVLRARCLAALERLGEARGLLDNALRDNRVSADVAAWILYGNVCARMEDPVRLRQAVNRILAIAPDRPEGHALRSLLMRMVGQNEQALRSVETSLAINPRDPELWVIRGLILAELGQFEDSQRSLAAAIRLQPENVNANKLMQVVSTMTNGIGPATAAAE